LPNSFTYSVYEVLQIISLLSFSDKLLRPSEHKEKQLLQQHKKQQLPNPGIFNLFFSRPVLISGCSTKPKSSLPFQNYRRWFAI